MVGIGTSQHQHFGYHNRSGENETTKRGVRGSILQTYPSAHLGQGIISDRDVRTYYIQ